MSIKSLKAELQRIAQKIGAADETVLLIVLAVIRANTRETQAEEDFLKTAGHQVDYRIQGQNVSLSASAMRRADAWMLPSLAASRRRPHAAATSERVGLCCRPRAVLAVFMGWPQVDLNWLQTHIRHDLVLYPVFFRCTSGATRNRIKRD
jgi:hypothetical protein